MEHLIPLKKEFEDQKLKELVAFLDAGDQLEFTKEDKPIISIILVLYNRAELSFACIKSIRSNCNLPIEIICIDNNSTDLTNELFKYVQGVKYIKNETNLNFLKACNQANEIAKGKYLLFLNNDATIRPGAVQNALRVFQEEKMVGAVGAKIILLDGKLQEAGSITWKDGSCLGYGRSDDPQKAEYNFRRRVNFCSGAFLITPKKLFDQMGGFDEKFAPAYYEETDYCLSLQEAGYFVYYEPNCVIDHFEFASSSHTQDAIELQRKNQLYFYQKHQEYLDGMLTPDIANTLEARKINESKRILFIDDRIPHQDLGAGFPRSNLIIQALVDLNYDVTVYSLNFPKEGNWEDIYRDLDPKVEVVFNYRRERFIEFQNLRSNYYDLIWVSRPHNFEFLVNKLSGFKDCKIIYDAEAVFSERAVEKSKLEGEIIDEEVLFNEELALCEYADAVVTVKEKDQNLFEDFGNELTYVLNVAFNIPDYIAPFNSRNDLLFVGNLDFDDSPNVDSIEWFVREIFDPFQEKLGQATLHLVGSSKSKKIRKLGHQREDIVIHGTIDDLTNIYNQCRVFLAPTRYAAGSPAKVFMAAAHGIPVLATELIINQLQWKQGKLIDGAHHDKPKEFLSRLIKLYSDESHWNLISKSGLKEIKKFHSISAFKDKLKQIINTTLEEDTSRKVIESKDVDITDENLLKIREKLNQLQADKIELQNQILEGEKYVLKLLDEINKKNIEIEKRGNHIKILEQSIFTKITLEIKSFFSGIISFFRVIKYYAHYGLKFFVAFLKNPIKFIRLFNTKSLKMFFIAIKEEPLSIVLSNLKNKISKEK